MVVRSRPGMMNEQCAEYVYVKDQYRRTGRGPGGFEMHYNRRRCMRFAEKGRTFCWQHPHSDPGGKKEEES